MRRIMPYSEVVAKSKWLTFNRIIYPEDDPSNPDDGYYYSHEIRCHGEIVSILPYMKGPDGSVSYLLREEVTPPWHIFDSQLSSITGGVDEGNSPLKTAKIELLEETGYSAEESEFTYLGSTRGSKSSDTVYHYFTVCLNGKTRGEASGDGSSMEKLAKCVWYDSIEKAVDPLVYVAFYKMNAIR